jgi:hypothetical protein
LTNHCHPTTLLFFSASLLWDCGLVGILIPKS